MSVLTPAPGEMNVSFDTLVQNIEENIRRGYRQPRPGALTPAKYMLLAGGPSLNDYESEIRELADEFPVVTVNGTYQWCLQRGIEPFAMVMVDARPENSRFIPAIGLNTEFFLASQVHPSIFPMVPMHRRWMWHNDASPEVARVFDRIYGREQWMRVRGGPTVTLRALSLFRALGWCEAEVYGLDGNLRVEGISHAYEQDPEGEIWDIMVRGRHWLTTPWMLAQAQDFLTQMRHMPDLQVTLHGDTLMTHMVQTLQDAPGNAAAAPL
jgi:hypothetical protein